MAGVILAVLEQPEAEAPVLAGAAGLARLTGAARINALAIRVPPLETIVPGEEVLTHRREAEIRASEQRRTAALKAGFDAWAAGIAITTEWFDVEGRADAVVRELGARSDAIVLKRPGAREGEPERQAIHAALFDTDRPVLMIPAGWATARFGQRIAIAWRDDARTVRAVLAALRFIGAASHVDVLVGIREHGPLPRLPAILDEHGIAAALHVLPIHGHPAFGATLLAKAHALGSDMLVMGAFAHHPLRTFILGGVTRYMLAHADLPVFMRH